MNTITVDHDGPLLRITLARPEQRNAFNPAMLAELTEAFSDVGDARAALLSGEGPALCAGADIDWMRSAGQLSEPDNAIDALRIATMLEAIDTCPAPVICRAHGAVYGGGIGLVACADIALADADCTFAFSETRIGVIPAVVSRYAIRAIHERAARRYFITGERFDAPTAARLGLIHETATDLNATTLRVLGELLAAGPEAAREAKTLVRDQPGQLEAAQRLARRRASREGQEGLAAFLERREPAWRSDASS